MRTFNSLGMGSGRAPTEIPNIQYFIHGNGDTCPPQLSHQPGKNPPVLGRLMEAAILPSLQALPNKASGWKSQRSRSIELKAADAASEGWDTGSTDHDICNYGKPDKENQISCFRAWADEPKGQEGISLPLHSSAQLGQCITGCHKSGIVFASPFGSPWHKSWLRQTMPLPSPTFLKLRIPIPRRKMAQGPHSIHPSPLTPLSGAPCPSQL